MAVIAGTPTVNGAAGTVQTLASVAAEYTAGRRIWVIGSANGAFHGNGLDDEWVVTHDGATNAALVFTERFRSAKSTGEVGQIMVWSADVDTIATETFSITIDPQTGVADDYWIALAVFEVIGGDGTLAQAGDADHAASQTSSTPTLGAAPSALSVLFSVENDDGEPIWGADPAGFTEQASTVAFAQNSYLASSETNTTAAVNHSFTMNLGNSYYGGSLLIEIADAAAPAEALAAILTGTSDLTAATGQRTADLVLGISASSNTTAVGASTGAEALQAQLDGTSDTTADGNRSASLASQLVGTSSLSAGGARTAGLSAAPSGTSSVSGDGQRTAALVAQFAGASDLESNGGAAANLAAQLDGTSDTTATGRRTAALEWSWPGLSDVVASGQSTTPLSTVVTGTSSLTATGQRTAGLSAQLDGTSDTTGVGTAEGVTPVSAQLDGSSGLTASGSRIAAVAAVLSGTSDLTATGEATAPEVLAAQLDGTSDFSASGQRTAALSTSITATSNTAAGVSTQFLSATFSGRSILVEGRSSMAYKKERATGSQAVAPLFPNGGVGLDAYAEYLREIKQLGGMFNTVGMAMGGTDNLPTPSRDPARSCGPVFACMTTRMHVFSEITFAFQKRNDDGFEGPLYRDGRLSLLETPWQGATTGDLLSVMEMDATTSGNSFWVASEEGTELIRLEPEMTSIVLEPVYAFRGSGVIGLRKIAYIVNHPESEPVVYLPDEVAHYMPIPDPAAPWRGMSWINPLLGSEGDVDSFIQSHKKASLKNRAAPALAVVFPPLASKEVVSAYRDEFERIHGDGPANRGKTIFTGGGADIKTIGMTWEDLDLRAVQGHGETRIAACAGVPPIIVGLSEGLLAATYSNYGQARRRFADGTLRHLWRSATSALETLMPAPRKKDRLWYSDRHVDFVQEDVKDEADIRKSHAQTIRQLIDIGFEPDVAVTAVESGDLTQLVGAHTGLFSVQLQPPMTSNQIEEGIDEDEDEDEDEDQEVNA